MVEQISSLVVVGEGREYGKDAASTAANEDGVDDEDDHREQPAICESGSEEEKQQFTRLVHSEY